MISEKKFKALSDLICRHGIVSIKKEERPKIPTDPRIAKRFYRKCFEGWKKAQEIILAEQLVICTIPNFRSQPALTFYLRALQRLMDAIMWTHLARDPVDIRRFYNEQASLNNLFEQNIESAIAQAAKINEDKDQFALITDLTSGVKLGDLILFRRGEKSVQVIELKEGPKNEVIVDAIQQKQSGDAFLFEEILRDPTLAKQAQRTLRQHERANNELKILYSGQGQDELSSRPRRVLLSEIPLNTFHKDLHACLKSAQTGEFGFAIVESCLLITAAHLKQHKDSQERIEKEIVSFDGEKERRFGINLHWNQALLQSVGCAPIVCQPISTGFMYKILTGELAVYMYFSAKKFVETFSGPHGQLGLVSGKAFRRHMAQPQRLRPMEFNGHGIECKVQGGIDAFLFPGLLQRIPALLATPKSIYEVLCYMSQNMSKSFGENSTN